MVTEHQFQEVIGSNLIIVNLDMFIYPHCFYLSHQVSWRSCFLFFFSLFFSFRESCSCFGVESWVVL